MRIHMGLGMTSLSGSAAASPTSGTVALVTSNGVNKNSGLTLSGGNLTATSTTAAFTFQGVRADTAKTGKRQFELTIGTLPNNGALTYIGIDDGSTDFSVAGTAPGKDNSTGIFLRVNGTVAQIYKNTAAVGGGGQAVVSTDVLTLEYDTTANTATFYINGTQFDLTQTGLGSTWNRAFVGFEDGNSGTVNFGGSAFTHALSSGYSAYQT